MSLEILDSEVDIVIAALQPNLTAFFEAWRPFFSRFHIIVVKDPDLAEELQIPAGFDLKLYTKSDMGILGTTSIDFSGHSCRYFGYLVSRKKYVISIDDNCLPAKDNGGLTVDAIAQHMSNLKTPATPFFFNTLYDPFRKGADFVRGYPFSLREGVECMLSCGLWLHNADYDPMTHVVKRSQHNTKYVDAVMTVPLGAMMPVSGINVAFNREVLGPVMFPALRLRKEGKHRWDTLEDVWNGLCAKVVCDRLGYGMKTGLPYVIRSDAEAGKALESLKEWEGVKVMDVVLSFFESLKLSSTAVTVEDCVKELTSIVKENLGPQNAIFAKAADAMEEWTNLWKAHGAQNA
ncbi:probable inactive UDP-arabinopyranose mutase 2 [Oryza brachyantha]|uniref:UDP-arabinopyranose mutase n=1 Tax=Oryza brachyantha TaxID=4533 RepID=J3M2A1_ORYBR|nr:probable inactive UDP-arabinopyranose mutase 2 [Oryza brachyantha]XP_006652955.1 probable inactive UDP-arabinopyranose mutase 2 [Oryza brachyantha]